MFNPEVIELLKKNGIDVDQGLLCLLGIFHDLKIEGNFSEEVIKKVSTAHIVSKDYELQKIEWLVPLFKEGPNLPDKWDWVEDWREIFVRAGGSERGGTRKEVLERMKKFLTDNPEFSRNDVFEAVKLYLMRERPQPKYIISAHYFIKKGIGKEAVSALLKWCEIVQKEKIQSQTQEQIKGKLLS
jgi:hypothetical protein